MINKAILVGNLGREPTIQYSKDGKAIANLAIATKESWTDKEGNKQERTEWHRVSVFGKLADICQRYLHKGSKVYLEGKIQTKKWEKEGITHYTTEIVLSGFNCTMMMLDSKSHGVDPQDVVAVTEQPKIEPVKIEPVKEDFEDEIPF